MADKILMKQAAEVISNAAGADPIGIEHRMECITRLARDLELTLEEITPELFVARSFEEGGQKFDFWLYSKGGKNCIGQTVTGATLK